MPSEMTIDLRTESKPQHQTRHNNPEFEASAKQDKGGFTDTFSLNQEQRKYPLTQHSHSIDELITTTDKANHRDKLEALEDCRNIQGDKNRGLSK